MRYEFTTANRIIFGVNTLSEIGSIAAQMGKRAMVITGVPDDLTDLLLASLKSQDVSHLEPFLVQGEPTVAMVMSGLEEARSDQVELLVGIGGGSAMDTAKAISILASNPGDPYDYLEVIGQGKPFTESPLPCIAIPTTAGTGAEVTRNAVLGSPEHAMKVSLRSPLMLPKVALVDPALTYSLPAEVTASTGMDALTQLIEPYVSSRANPLTDPFCREGIHRASRSLKTAYHEGTNLKAREDMSLASLLGGLALANAGLGAVHGFASPIGGMFPAPHGAVCACLLPPVMATNVHALLDRQKDHPAVSRYTEIARMLTGNSAATADDGVIWVRDLAEALSIPRLATYGIRRDDFPVIIDKAIKASSMKANPLPLLREELAQILEEAF